MPALVVIAGFIAMPVAASHTRRLWNSDRKQSPIVSSPSSIPTALVLVLGCWDAYRRVMPPMTCPSPASCRIGVLPVTWVMVTFAGPSV